MYKTESSLIQSEYCRECQISTGFEINSLFFFFFLFNDLVKFCCFILPITILNHQYRIYILK